MIANPAEVSNNEVKIRFRNYTPYDSRLQEKPSKEVEKMKIEKEMKIDHIQQEIQAVSSEELHIVPKKENWDLKSHIQPRLDKLQKRTKRAIVEILREKMIASENENDNNDDEEE